MKSLSLVVCALSLLLPQAALASTLVQRQYGGGGYGGGGSTNTPTTGSNTPTTGSNTPTTGSNTNTGSNTSSSSSTSSTTGDRQCGTSLCVSATKNGSTVDYVLESRAGTPGWMAMGIGSQMAGAQMFILWANSDGSITLSQRLGAGEFEPEVDTNPARVATVSQALSTTSGTAKYAFSIPADTTTKQGIIWAYSSRNPGNPAVGAPLSQHLSRGTLTLDLSKALSTGGADDDDDGIGGNAPSGSGVIPLLPFQKVIVAHAIFCLVGFLFFLPAGALLARFFRTYTHKWFFGHWLIQFYIAGPIILIGIILGIVAVQQAGAPHFSDNHMRWGLVLFILYIVQCSLGAFIHFIKTNTKRRPPQNYLHAVLGLAIIGLALFQVRNGYYEEWPDRTGRERISGVANVIWFIWVVLLPVLYLIGLAFLPRQFRQERASRAKASGLVASGSEENINMTNRYRD